MHTKKYHHTCIYSLKVSCLSEKCAFVLSATGTVGTERESCCKPHIECWTYNTCSIKEPVVKANISQYTFKGMTTCVLGRGNGSHNPQEPSQAIGQQCQQNQMEGQALQKLYEFISWCTKNDKNIIPRNYLFLVR